MVTYNSALLADSGRLSPITTWITTIPPSVIGALNWNNSTGSEQFRIGGQGALFNSTGTWMTGLGHSADASAGVTNSTVIGDAAIVNASSKVRIGDGSMTGYRRAGCLELPIGWQV